MEIKKIKTQVAAKMAERNEKIKALREQRREEMQKLRRNAAKTVAQKFTAAKEIKNDFETQVQKVKQAYRPAPTAKAKEGDTAARILPIDKTIKLSISAGGGRRNAARSLRKK